jgi:transposase-like protein
MERSSAKSASSVKVSKERKEILTQLLDLGSRALVKMSVHEYLNELLQFTAELMMNKEVIELVGQRYNRDAERDCQRWGSQIGSGLLLGQRVPLEKPRVRTKGKGSSEVELKTYEELNSPDLLNQAAAAKLITGVSTRRYPKTVEKLLRGRGIGRQTISRRGAEEMAEQLAEFQTRSFEGTEFVTMFMDGIGLGERICVAAVGMDKNGKKHVLGFEQGSTENSGTCRKLLSNLIDRGILEADGGYLFVIDGGKGLLKAINEVFGNRVEVQRCTEHKKRNVEDQLPKQLHKWFRQKFAAAFSKKSHKEAEKAFVNLRRELEKAGYSKAAQSLLEGSTQMLTLHKLGVTGALRRSLSTTNSIESLFSAGRYYMRNVKRWRNEEQRDRWLATGLLEAEKNLRSVPGYTQIKKLKEALNKTTKPTATATNRKK